MTDELRGGAALTAWRESQEPYVAAAALGRRTGDIRGLQIGLFERDVRSHLPFPLLIAVLRETGLPVEVLGTEEQIALCRDTVLVVARSAAA